MYLRGVELVLEQLLLLRGDLVDEALDVLALLLRAAALLVALRAPTAAAAPASALLAFLFLFFSWN